MKHLGDITKINWFEVETVDCVTGGSPCQDLSVAGKRAGLAGERSGLYMEQIRCIKELRQQDVNNGRTGTMVRPRFMVWENVPGAFSSNGGKDFAAVLEEAVKIVEPQAPPIPVPGKGWPSAGCLSDVDGKWSIAWRVHDAQFWGVPQRRKRIALVCDFGGMSAPEVLFERKGLSRDPEQSGAEREEAARTAGSSLEGTGGCLTGWDCQSKRIFSPDGICATLNSGDKEGGNITPSVFCHTTERPAALSTLNNQSVLAFDTTQITSPLNGNNPKYGDPCHPLAAGMHPPTVVCLNDQGGSIMSVSEDVSGCLRAQEHGHQPIINTYQQVTGPLMANSHPGSYCGQDAYNDMLIAHTLKGKSNCDHREDSETYPITANTVRRLTPLECERLQDYPDGWTDIGEWIDSKGKRHKAADSPRYKAIGNSIALPFWFWLLRRISAQYERPATLGSLFDGIGGFPLCWERCNGKGTALWASEIEEFPMAVTKVRFSNESLR